jgi:hypothetical protein
MSMAVGPGMRRLSLAKRHQWHAASRVLAFVAAFFFLCSLFSGHETSDENHEDRLEKENVEPTWILRRRLGLEQGNNNEGKVNAASLQLQNIILRAFASREEVIAAEQQLRSKSDSELRALPILRGNPNLMRNPNFHSMRLAGKLNLKQTSNSEPKLQIATAEALPNTGVVPVPQLHKLGNEETRLSNKELAQSNSTFQHSDFSVEKQTLNSAQIIPGVESAGSSGSASAFLPKIRPPEGQVPNCQLCPPPIIPEFCSFAPHPLAPLDTLLKLDQGITSRFSWSAPALAAFDPATGSQAPFELPPEEVKNTVQQLLDQWQSSNGSCGLWTRDCVRRHLSGERLPYVPMGPERCFADGKLPEGHVLELFPDLNKGVFGSCAVVAVSHNLLGKGRGPEIDAHDTIFR